MGWKPYYRKNGERVKHVFWRGDKLTICFWARGQNHTFAVGSASIKDAEHLLRLKRGQFAAGRAHEARPPRVTFEELAEAKRIHYRTFHRDREAAQSGDKHAKSRIKKGLKRMDQLLVHLRKDFGHALASEISHKTITAYVARRQEEGATNGTINRELGLLNSMFNIAAAEGTITVRPTFPRLPESRPKEGFLTYEEFTRFHACLPDRTKPFALLLFETGFRLAEARDLTWEKTPESSGVVDLERRQIRLKASATKNGQGRRVFMSNALYAALLAQKAERDFRSPKLPWVWFREGRGGKKLIRYKDVRTAWKKALKEAGLDPNISRHDMRRSAIREITRLGIGERVAMETSGHKTRNIFEQYNIPDDEDQRRVAEALNTRNRRETAAQGDLPL